MYKVVKHWCEEHWTLFTLSNMYLPMKWDMCPQNVIKEHFKSTWLQEHFSEIEVLTEKKKLFHFIFKVSNNTGNWEIKIIPNNFFEHKMSKCQGLLKKEL